MGKLTRTFTVAQKKALLFISCIIGTLSRKDLWEDFNLSYDIRKQIEKVIEETVKLGKMFKVTKEEADKLQELTNNQEYIIDIFTKTELQVHLKKYRSQTIVMKREDIFSLIEHAMIPCHNCSRNIKHCQLRKVLRSLEIDALDPERMYRCEYCISRKEVI